MKKLTKEEIKKIQIEMLAYIDKICQENNIKYTLVGGSLIGAIRHKGMIPWDDDIDIALTYDEFNKLTAILRNSNSDYQLLNHDINKDFYMPFNKLVYTKTVLQEQGFDYISGYGVFVDIFCYHNISNNAHNRQKYFKKLKFYNTMLGGIKRVYKDDNFCKNILKYLRYYTIRIVGKEYYFNRLKKLYAKYREVNTDYVLSDWPVYSMNKEIKKRAYFENYLRVPFENIEVSIIKEYDKYLTEVFGDYMTPPPVEKRKTHELLVYWKEENKNEV